MLALARSDVESQRFCSQVYRSTDGMPAQPGDGPTAVSYRIRSGTVSSHFSF